MEEEDGREAEKKGDVTSNRQPMGVREGGREHGRRRVCFSITAASAERRGAQSISQRGGRKTSGRGREEEKEGRREFPEERSLTVEVRVCFITRRTVCHEDER